MGARDFLLIVEIIELATEATLTVAEVTANILSEISSSVIDGIIDSVETASDAFDSLGSSTLQTRTTQQVMLRNDAIRNALEDLKGDVNSVFNLVTKPRDAWRDYLDNLTERTSIRRSRHAVRCNK